MGLLKPSMAHVWLKCPKSPTLCASIPQTDTDATLSGTLCHLQAAYEARETFGIPQIPMEFKLDDARKAEAKQYASYCSDIVKGVFGSDGFTPLVEEKVSLSEYLFDGNGIIDFGAYNDKAVVILDYKSGYAKVGAQGNPQLYLYALAMMSKLRKLGTPPKEIYIGIVQPSQRNYPFMNLKPEEIEAWAKDAEPKILAAYTDKGEYSPGQHCSQCWAKGLCRAYLLYALEGRKEAKEDEIERD